jgi:hypothetical protein
VKGRRATRTANGAVFDRLTVVAQLGGILVRVRCSCGSKQKVVRRANLNAGRTRSCGCLATEVNTRHGRVRSYAYRFWSRHAQRRCAGWTSAATFLADIGEENHPDERLASEGRRLTCGACAECLRRGHARSVSWTTPEVARAVAASTSGSATSRKLVAAGQRRTLKEWAERAGLTRQAIWSRLGRGWSREEACTIPRGGRRTRPEEQQP